MVKEKIINEKSKSRRETRRDGWKGMQEDR